MGGGRVDDDDGHDGMMMIVTMMQDVRYDEQNNHMCGGDVGHGGDSCDARVVLVIVVMLMVMASPIGMVGRSVYDDCMEEEVAMMMLMATMVAGVDTEVDYDEHDAHDSGGDRGRDDGGDVVDNGCDGHGDGKNDCDDHYDDDDDDDEVIVAVFREIVRIAL